MPLPDVVIAALAAHLRAFPAGDLGPVVHQSGGGAAAAEWLRDTVGRPAVRRAGLPPGTGFHDLRHYYRSLGRFRAATSASLHTTTRLWTRLPSS